MKISKLLSNIVVDSINIDCDIEIENITFDSRDVQGNTLFVAIKGFQTDGHNYIEGAIANGSVAILYESGFNVDDIKSKYSHVAFVESKNTRDDLSYLASRLYNEPTKKSSVVAVCGTNGKTTTTYLIKAILEHSKHKTTLIGTIQNMIGDRVIASKHTTPESSDLQKIFADMLEEGSYHAVMEASSHALLLGRCNSIDYDSVIFTNFTEDHLDFHKSMEEYLKAKCLIFDILAGSSKSVKKVILNTGTDEFDTINNYAKNLGLDVVTYGLSKNAKYYADIRKLSINTIEYDFYIDGKLLGSVALKLLGKFNVLNSLAALAYANEYGYDISYAIESIKEIQVGGRFEIVTTRDMPFTVVVDYAHTPDGLINVLSAARKLNPSRVITVFGCGGDRDRKKRPIMANAVETHSDEAFLTLDNPRTEDFDQIMNDIESGFSSSFKYTKIISRKDAIIAAIKEAKENDIVVIAGKGHEDYQIFRDETIHFDDREVAREALSSIFQ